MRLIAIKDGVVSNVIAVDDASKARSKAYLESQGFTVLENGAASPGDLWDGTNFTTPEPVVIPEPRKTKLTRLEFMKRFTAGELGTLYTVAKTNVNIQVWLEMFSTAEFVDLTDQATIDGINTLEYAGLLAAGRAAEIMV